MWIASADLVEVSLGQPIGDLIPPTAHRPLLVLFYRHAVATSLTPIESLNRPELLAGLCIGPAGRSEASEIIEACRDLLTREPSTHVVFVPRLEPPRKDHREDPAVDTVLTPAATFRQAVYGSRDPAHAAYLATSAVMRPGSLVRQLLVRTIGERQSHETDCGTAPLTMCIPHRGSLDMLETCMHYVNRQRRCAQKTAVYFDQDVSDEQHQSWLGRHPAVEPYTASRWGAGPYPGRHHVCSNASTPWVGFQDSDDAPCADRVERLEDAFDEADLVGSHELRLDEFREVAFPVRYPLDANAALAREASHALLHPTSMVRTSAYLQSGGLSTHLVAGSDTQFLLRAHFSMRIRNVDAFLYVKRDRAGTLTRAPTTRLGSPERLRLNALWVDAFFRICRGEVDIERTALAAEHDHGVAVEPVRR